MNAPRNAKSARECQNKSRVRDEEDRRAYFADSSQALVEVVGMLTIAVAQSGVADADTVVAACERLADVHAMLAGLLG